MSIISIPNTFTVGAVIVASQHNSNFSVIYSDYNGNIDNSNISASAAIVDTKLAQISTAGKVSGAAFASLASIPAGAGIIPSANVPAATPQVGFGAPVSKNAGTTYQAATDGIVQATSTSNASGEILKGITDSGAAPTTVVQLQQASSGNNTSMSIIFIVLKNNYYKVTFSASGTADLYTFTSLGS